MLRNFAILKDYYHKPNKFNSLLKRQKYQDLRLKLFRSFEVDTQEGEVFAQYLLFYVKNLKNENLSYINF